MRLDEYASYDGLGLSALVKDKEVKASELRELALEAITLLNPELNAVVQTLHQDSQEEINKGLPNGLFHGVPFLIKELVLHKANVPVNMGSQLTEGLTFPVDSELMKRYKEAGLLTVGTTTTPEFGYNATTESVFYGATRNPWDSSLSPGGSSGGSAASIAAGVVPVAHANDGGGSIRIPASCNGLVGLKPTRGRIPAGPYNSEPLNGIAIEFALTKTVRDTAALLDAVSGPDIGCYGWAEPPVESFSSQMKKAPRKLKIALMRDPLSHIPVDEDCLNELDKTAKLCEELGHEVIEVSPAVDAEALSLSTLRIWTTNIRHMINGAASMVNRIPSQENLESGIWACYEFGGKISGEELLQAIDINAMISRVIGEFFTKYDVILSPVTAQKPLPLGTLNCNKEGLTAEDWTNQIFTYAPYTNLYNATETPAISLPLGWSKEGLPIGMQFASAFSNEGLLLSLAVQLEEAAPWSSKQPKINIKSMSST
ncbi:amidase [Halobacillus trueperi]|uniref:Amidase n=1 Tax=Halobacillus trueperi TaxID=156205 RepID=A0A3D8VQ46_9BACI|nr:amidase family protein [Halobacillus trueperi]RDY71387.1 amidase [Halobacillus trueperi]